MRLGLALREKLMDVRVRDKLVAEGKLTKEEVQQYIDSLPDDTENVSYTDSVDSRESSESNTH